MKDTQLLLWRKHFQKVRMVEKSIENYCRKFHSKFPFSFRRQSSGFGHLKGIHGSRQTILGKSWSFKYH